MADNYQNIKGTMRPSFRISPDGVELISKLVPNSNLRDLYIKKGKADSQESRILTDYDMTIPTNAIATYTETQDLQNGTSFVEFHLRSGETLRIPKTISNLEQAGTVIGPDISTPGHIAVFKDRSGLNIDDQGYGVIDSMKDDPNANYLTSTDIPTARAVWGLVGEPKLLLYARLHGLLDTSNYVIEPDLNGLDNYTVSLMVDCISELPESFDHISVVYNYGDNEITSTEAVQLDELGMMSYYESQISDQAQNSYAYRIISVPMEKSLAFKIRVYDRSLGVFDITADDGHAFLVEPDGNDLEKALVRFSYPSVRENIVGTYSQLFGGDVEYVLSQDDKKITERYIFYNKYVSERAVYITDFSLTKRSGQYFLSVLQEGINRDFEYELILNIDGDEVTYSVTGTNVILTVEDTAKIDAATRVTVTPRVWQHSMATYVVKGI